MDPRCASRPRLRVRVLSRNESKAGSVSAFVVRAEASRRMMAVSNQLALAIVAQLQQCPPVATRDLHDEPFDEGTKTKLTIYRSYVQAWLQVFLHSPHYSQKPLQFFDFFSGPGEDSKGEPGSPMILLEELRAQHAPIQERGHDIRIFFNDQKASKIDALKDLCARLKLPWQPHFEKIEFSEAFQKLKGDFDQGPSLVFLDQNGLKHVTRDVFVALADARKTDFIFFTASSYKHRFGDLLAPEIKLPENASYLEVHRMLADVYRGWAPADLYLGHFSIKKDSNIYGLIFGSHHWRGMQKFLEIAWRLDAACGEADYEMEAGAVQGEMDFDLGKPSFKKRKVEVFQEELKDAILARKLKTDEAVFLCCLTNGFLPRFAKPVYDDLRQNGTLLNHRSNFPRCSDATVAEPRDLQL